MNPLLVVVLCAAVIVTIVIATKKSKKNAKANISSQQVSANQSRVNKSNLIRCKADGIWDKDGTSGYYENGNIYCCSKIRDYQIGTYVQETNESLTVKNTRGYVIGSVSGSHIILSRAGQLACFKDMGFHRSTSPILFDCAELFDNCICDRTPEMNCVALCSGTPESAATFICLQYDGLGINSESPFHQFWY